MSVGTVPEPILIVGHENFDHSFLCERNLLRLEYSFVAEHPNDGFAAWRVESPVTTTVRVEVANSARAYTGGFSQQALNRFFADILIGQRVSAVVIVGLYGCTVDLPRVSALLGIPSVLLLHEPAEALSSLNKSTAHWLCDSLKMCHLLIPAYPEAQEEWSEICTGPPSWGEYDQLESFLDSFALPSAAQAVIGFDYSTYEFCQRDHPLLKMMQKGDTTHFSGCKKVLDAGCGVGIFLDCLRDHGIDGVGVERDPVIVEYGKGMGLNIVNADALSYLEQSNELYDGVYCSHFVEHLPIELVEKLIKLVAGRLELGGVAVFVFPDPESIRSQLLGFWRDPEHVRFYHPELVTAVAASAGLELEWSSYDAQPHHVMPFSEQPPAVSDIGTLPSLSEMRNTMPAGNWIESILSKLGLVSRRRFEGLEASLRDWCSELEKAVKQQDLINSQIEQRTDSLWGINQTWAWNDNATLKFRKRAN